MANTIPVNIPDHEPYEIVIQQGLLDVIANNPAEYGLEGRVIIGTNTTVAPLYAEKLAASLPDAHLITMGDGESYKNLDTVRDLYDQCFAHGADRHTTMIALGGGVVGDTIGFVAATFMRGIRLIQMPTSLLAMVDSSVGGKVGVDVPQGKNLIGAFKQPEIVLIDPDVLATLSDEQWRCGMAEIIKHGLIADEGLLDTTLHNREYAAELVARAVQVKVDVVEQDPYERGVRAHLNLGHTFGHAIEHVTQYEWLHGEGVGFGLLAAAMLSHKLGMIDNDLVGRIELILEQTGLPRRLSGIDPEAIYDAMTTDKKWKNGISRFVLLEGLNQPTICTDIPRETVTEILSGLQ